MNHFSRFILSIFIVALATAGVSPACEFISGKSLLEICAADGSLKTIEVPAEFDPLADQNPAPEHKTAKNDCSFCFFQSHTKLGSVAESQILLPQSSHDLLLFSQHKADTQSARFYNTRAPPPSLLI